MSPTLFAKTAAATALPRISIVVPTFNERENLWPLVERLEAVLQELEWEVIFVDDDSPDGTYDLAQAISRNNPRVRCLRRLGRRGLAGACIEGMLSTSADVIAVMDADLQHDETILPAMLRRINNGAALVVGSRTISGGTSAEGFGRARAVLSAVGSRAVRAVLRTEVRDVMSGFFMMRREIADDLAPILATTGFKILADVLAHLPTGLRVDEIPYHFRPRRTGHSKLDTKVALDFAALFIVRSTRGLLPLRFVFFAVVGSAGLVVHLAILRVIVVNMIYSFPIAQAVATFAAMIFNFGVNNALTYRDLRLHGMRMVYGSFVFCAVCSLGALANIGIADWLYRLGLAWWFAGTAGCVYGAISNYALSTTYVWPALQERRRSKAGCTHDVAGSTRL